MSAFVVSHKHINSILTYANRQRFAPHIRLADGETVLNLSDVKDLQRAAEIMLAENVLSVQARYPDTIDNPQNMPGVITEVGCQIKFRFISKPLNAVQVLKALQCYDYQACETDDYEHSNAYRIVESIRSLAISNLPGYEEAKWEID